MANGGSMDEHMADHVEAKMSKLANMKPPVLDAFTKLTSNIQKQRISAAISIITHLSQSEAVTKNANDELIHALNRLVRGIASSRLNSRAGFFSTLVCLLSKLKYISVTNVLDSIKKELKVGSGKTKTEISEAYTGQILAYGALFHSGLLMEATTEEQKEVITNLMQAGKRKSYLALVATTFIVSLLEKVDEVFVKDILWPILKEEIGKPWTDQTLDSLYILLIMQSKYPTIVKTKFINKSLGTPTIIHMNTQSECLNLLMNMPMLTTIHHPVYEEFCKHLVKSDILASFWEVGVDKHLEKSNYNKELLILKMILCILRNIEDKSEIPKLLTPRFSDFIRKSFLFKKGKTEIIMKLREFLNLLVSTLEGEDVSDDVRLKVIKKLLFHPDDFNLERKSGTKVIQLLSRQLKADGAKKLTKLFHKVISATENKNSKSWKNYDRQLAAGLLIRIMAHPELQGDLDWRVNQCQLLIDYSLFNSHSVGENSDQNIGPRLADSLKECFFRALDQRLPKLNDLRSLLSSVVQYINDKLKKNISLRHPLSEQSLNAWNKMLKLVKKMEKNSEDQTKLKSGSVKPVFHTMFLLMGLHLFSNPTMAQEALQELHSCYERSVNMKSSANDEDAGEPNWVEVAVDLMLSLLSHDSHLLRSLVSCVFPHLCTHLTPTAFHQIIQVLDPNSDQSPLSEVDKVDSETDDDDDDDEEGSQGESEKSDESDDSELFEDEEETVNDKLRMAVSQALGTAASLTDTESVDMDEMDEEEGKRLDAALSQAFCLLKNTKTKKSKKQSKEDEEVTHFRVRVIGLLKKYLSGEPDLALCLDLIIPLFELLEFCIKDPHQKPLEDTVGSCLKILSSIKKFSTVKGVTKQTIVSVLQKLLDKGQRTAPIYIDMGDKVTMCATFLVRCSELPEIEDVKFEKKKRKTVDKTGSVLELYQNSLEAFFKKRECLLQQNLFKSVLQMKWEGNWTLVTSLVAYAFDADVRPFKRNQALDLLLTFNQNRRLLSNLSPEKLNILKDIDNVLSTNTVTILRTLPTPTNHDNAQDTATGHVKQKFVCELIQLLFCIYQSRKKLNLGDNMDWKQISSALAHYRNNVDLSTDTKVAFNKLSRVLGFSSLKIRKPDKKSNENNGEVNFREEESESEIENETAENGMDKEISSKKRKRKSKPNNAKKHEEGSESENENAENDMDKEISSKKRKRKSKPNNEKKQAKKLRISALSEGLEDISFSKLNCYEISEESPLESKSLPNANSKHTKLKSSKKNNP